MSDEGGATPLLQALEDWLEELDAVAGRAETTLRSHEAHVRETVQDLAAQMGCAPTEVTFDDVTRERLSRALSEYRRRPDRRYRQQSDGSSPRAATKPRSTSSLQRRRAALGQFYKWAVRTGLASSDVVATFDPIRGERRLPKPLEADEVRAVMHAARTSSWPERDELLVLVLLTCGLRLREAAGLRLSSLRGSPPTDIRVVGKGDKERVVPLLPVVAAALERYWPTREQRLVESGLSTDALFLSMKSRRVGESPSGAEVRSVDLTAEGVAYVCETLLRSAGVARPGVRVHAMRHTFATDLVRSGSNLRAVQELLGHENLDTVQVYTAVSRDDLVEAVSALPVANDPSWRRGDEDS